MHKGFIDKNRRLFNLRQMQVENVLPEHFAQYYPKFITLLSKYYEWQETQNSSELINHLFASRDINETDIELLSYIEDELLLGDAYFEGFGSSSAEKRAAANFSNTLFRSKGTKFAIEWFFRSFYGVDAEVLYPKENIFKISDTNSTIGPSSLRYLTDDKLYQTYALLVRAEIPISKWKDVFKLFSHPAGMYLGGEVLISDVKNIITALPLGDSAVSLKDIPSYTLTAESNSVDEGQSLNFTVTGTNVIDNIDALYYYIENLSSTNEDFVEFFDSTSPGYVSINDVGGTAQGTFTITARLDSDETETTENFKVIIRDRNGFNQDSATISLSNILTTFNIDAVGSTTYDEGDVITFRVVGNSSNPPNMSLQYYVDPIGANPITVGDFTTPPPLIGSPASIVVVNDSARFTLQTLIEKTNSAEVDKSFRVVLQNGALLKDTSSTIVIQNVIPTFDVTFENSSIFEGQSLLATLTMDEYNIGTRIDWSLSGDITSDPRVTQLSGSFIANSVSTNFAIPFTKTDSVSATGSITGSLNISPDGFTPDPYTTETFTLVDSAATYSIVATPSAAAEGDSATFSFIGRNIPNGTTAYFYVDYNETDVSDFVSTPPLTGSRQAVTFTNNVGTPEVSLQFTTNGDSNETFTTNLSSSVGGAADLASRNFTITSVPYLLVPDVFSLDEGNSVVFTFSAAGIADGTYYYEVSGTNITAADFVPNAFFNGSQGSFVVSSGTGSFGITASNDLTFEGPETFTVDVSDTLGGTALASSPSITINDTSTPNYQLTAGPVGAQVIEGNEMYADIFNAVGETVYFEITGDATTKIATTQVNETITTSPQRVSFGLTTRNTTFDGDQAGVVTASRDDYASNGGTSIATASFDVIDDTQVILTASDTNPSEGDTITFNITSENLQDGTYYWRTGFNKAFKLTADAASGSTELFGSVIGGITGDTSDNVNVPGTVESTTSNSIILSDPITASFSSGDVIHFSRETYKADFVTPLHGTVSVASGIGSFDVEIAEDTDLTDPESKTFYLETAEALVDAESLAFEQISIQNTTVSAPDVDFTWDDGVYTLTAFDGPTSASITFNDDGTVTHDFGIPIVNDIGTWAVNPNISDFEVFVSRTNPSPNLNFNTSPSLSLNTWTPLASSLSLIWTGPQNSASNATDGVTVYIREIGDITNIDSADIRATLSTGTDK